MKAAWALACLCERETVSLKLSSDEQQQAAASWEPRLLLSQALSAELFATLIAELLSSTSGATASFAWFSMTGFAAGHEKVVAHSLRALGEHLMSL